MSSPVREVDPNDLRLPPSRSGGADPWKLHQQVRRFGSSKQGMPPILVYEDPYGVLEIIDGVTRASRIARLAPGETVPVVVIGRYPQGPWQFPAREGSVMSEKLSKTELFAALQSLSEIIPEMRAGQLAAAVGELCADLHGRGLWEASDAELLEAVWQFRRNYEAATVV
jgi:hypothetical protein